MDRSLFKEKNSKSISQEMISLTLELGDLEFTLDLFEDDLLSNELISEMMEKGLSPPITYEGYTSIGQRTRLTINEDFIYGFIEKNEITYYIEPASFTDKSAVSNAFIIYDGEAAMELNAQDQDHMCGYTEPITKSIKERVHQVPQPSSMACRGLKIAIASDHTMYAEYDNDENLVNSHNMGVLSNVQGDYDGSGSGAFDIELQVVAMYNATIASENPYNTTGTDAGVMLNEFRSWSIGGGFGSSATPHMQGGGSASGLAVLWSNKNITYGGSSSVVGLASTPGNHSVLEDYGGQNNNGSGSGLRVLQSHEMGHNLSYGHDTNGTCSGGSCIMWPSIQNTSTWSSASITAINNNLNGRSLTGCFASCSNGVQDIGELGVDCGGVCDPCPCTASDTYESPLSLTIQLDNYAEESSWDIRTSDGTVLHSASYSISDRGTVKNISNLNIDPANGITFSFYDSYGDGICCVWGTGSFTLRDATNTTIFSGGQFAASTSSVFCIDDNSCENGVQDPGEDAVDCGGSCTPCITGCMDENAHNYDASAQVDDGSCQTCSDGVQNGDEVAIDCGGSNCAPCISGCTNSNAHNYNASAQVDDGSCLTCSDGLQNGDETAVDCGGSICEPCITGCTDSSAHNYNPNAHISNNALCETCDDGKQNGDESGLDCGGERCSPCDCTTSDFVSGEEISSNVSVYASNTIVSADTIMGSNNVIYVAGHSITLGPGFEVEVSSIFRAQVEACDNN